MNHMDYPTRYEPNELSAAEQEPNRKVIEKARKLRDEQRQQLADYGCEFCTKEDRHGDTRSGYWLDGVFLGSTPTYALEAIRG